MRVIKSIFNFVSIQLSLVLSIFTFILILLTPIVSVGTSLLQSENIQQFLQDTQLTDQLESTLKDAAPDELENLGVNFIDNLMDTELMSDIVELYIDNMIGVLETDNIKSINTQDIQNLLKKHTPELVTLIRPYLPSDIVLSDNDISKYASDMLEPALTTMVSGLPTLEDLKIEKTTLTILRMFYDGSLVRYSFIAIGILSLLILIFRFPGFKGFLWLSITYLLNTVLLYLAGSNIDRFFSGRITVATTPPIYIELSTVTDMLKVTFSNGCKYTGILCISCITIFVVGRIILSLFKR